MLEIKTWKGVPPIIDIKMACALLGINRQTIAKLIKNKSMPGAVKIGNQYRIDTEQLHKYFLKGSEEIV